MRKLTDSPSRGSTELAAGTAKNPKNQAELATQVLELEARLAEAERKIETLSHQARVLENVHDAIVETDADFNITFWNRAAAELYGWPVEAVLGSSLKTVLHCGVPAEQLPQVLADLAQASLQRQPVRLELQQRGRHGRLLDVEAMVMALRTPHSDSGSQVSGYVAAMRDISDRKHLMAARGEAARRAKIQEAIFESMEEAVTVFDQEGCLVRANPRAVEFYGGDPTCIDAETRIQEMFRHANGRPAELHELPPSRALRGEKVRGERWQFRNAQGREYVLFISASTLLVDGEPAGAVAVWQDLTLHEQLQGELASQKALFDAVLAQLPVGISISEAPSGRDLYHNREAERLLGHALIPGDSIERYKDYRAVHPDGRLYRAEEYPTARAVRQGEVIREEEMLYQQGDGRQAIFSVSSTPVVDAHGNRMAAVSIFYDISDRKHAERALQQSEERFRWVLENSLDVAYRRDLITDTYDYISPMVEQMLGLTPEEMRSLPETELLARIHPEDLAGLEEQLAQAASAGKGKVEYRFRGKDGRYHWLADHVTILKDEQGRPLYRGGITRDVTESKRVEEALGEYARRLERSNQELQEFAYVASHDLQEPLRKVKAFSTALQRRLVDRITGDEREQFQRMEAAAGRMQEMIEALLELSRVTSQGQPFRPLDLGDTVEDVLSDLEVRLARTGGRVETGFLPSVEADPIQMQRLFLNLIGNGLKYSRADTPPVVKVEGTIVHAKGRHLALIRVEDNGIGFDMQHLEHIFQPFQRLHGRTQYEGTGMGLAICKKIVDRHGGSITAQSQPGKGSVFIVTLPVKHNKGFS